MRYDLVGLHRHIDELIEENGEEVFRYISKLRKKKVNAKRDVRIQPRWKEIKRKAEKQGWLCSICKLEGKEHRLIPKAGDTVADHIDVNRVDFNNPVNWAAADSECNARKNAKSIQKMSKQTGATFVLQLEQGK